MPRRHSLLVRLLMTSVLISACSIAATAWLTTRTTTGSIQRQQGESVARDARIYDAMLEYAATHRNWSGVQSTVDDLAKQTGRRIALTTSKRQLIADSADPAGELPTTQSATVDPLDVDLTLKPGASDRIDSRAVGPYRLSGVEREALRARLTEYVECGLAEGVSLTVADDANGRPVLKDLDLRQMREIVVSCGDARLVSITKTDYEANVRLLGLLNACLSRRGLDKETLSPEYYSGPEAIAGALSYRSDTPQVASCLDTARREQLAPHVAPAALLFVMSPGGAAPPKVGLSAAGTTQIGLVALAVLLVTVCAAWLAASRLVRPIRALTSAAQRMGASARAVRVDPIAKGEVGQLAEAFNAMSARLENTEAQRKAMVSDIAHELRTPLGNVRGWLEATQDGVATIEPELISSLLEEVVLLQYLVDDLQDLAQADAGTLALHPEPIDARDLVDQVTAAHQGRADKNGVTLRAATRGRLELTADPARLRQALGNLVTNAVRYTPPGGEVTVTGRRVDGNIVLEVVDTGAGISAQDVPYVFDRFWRADRSRSRNTGGSGLGLAITRHIVEAHGGSVSAESILGGGSTFRLVLPAASEALGAGTTGLPGPRWGPDGRRGSPGTAQLDRR
ncbi:MAG TPA: ATP-binding protein [Pilimelia sp.]|nr:ATP-binding protein [Pilimelia sp.]